MRTATLMLWRLVLAAAFLLAAWGKWQSGVSQGPFPETIYDRIVRGHVWVHGTLLGLEAGMGLWLLWGWRRRTAAAIVMALLLAMSLLLVRELVSPDPLGCGCGLQPVVPGRGPQEVRQELLFSLLRNLLLLLGAAYLLLPGSQAACAAPPEGIANSPAPRQD